MAWMALLKLIALTLFVETALGVERSATRTSVRALAATGGGRRIEQSAAPPREPKGTTSEIRTKIKIVRVHNCPTVEQGWREECLPLRTV